MNYHRPINRGDVAPDNEIGGNDGELGSFNIAPESRRIAGSVRLPISPQASNDEDDTIFGSIRSSIRSSIRPGGFDEEERLRQEEQRRHIRRMRLIIRPAVILVLGFFVFRNTNKNRHFRNAWGDQSERFFNGLRMRQQTSSNQEHYGTAAISSNTIMEMASTSTTEHNPKQANNAEQTHDLIRNHNRNNIASAAMFPLFRGNPTASMYNIVTDINDDDSNEEYPNQGDLTETQNPGTSRDSEQKGFVIDNDNNEDNNDDPASSYGWVPELFPDPLIDPVRCGIAYLSKEPIQGNVAEEERREGLVVPEPNITEGTSQNLRLCDPDWVLGGAYLEQIARKMEDFSNRFIGNDLAPDIREDTQQEEQDQKSEGLDLAVATVRKVCDESNFLLSVVLQIINPLPRSYYSYFFNLPLSFYKMRLIDEYPRCTERRGNVLRIRRRG